jgi:hypothetical protein
MPDRSGREDLCTREPLMSYGIVNSRLPMRYVAVRSQADIGWDEHCMAVRNGRVAQSPRRSASASGYPGV